MSSSGSASAEAVLIDQAADPPARIVNVWPAEG